MDTGNRNIYSRDLDALYAFTQSLQSEELCGEMWNRPELSHRFPQYKVHEAAPL